MVRIGSSLYIYLWLAYLSKPTVHSMLLILVMHIFLSISLFLPLSHSVSLFSIVSTEPVSGSPRLLGAAQGMVNGQRHANGVGHSPDGPQPSPLTSPLLNDAATRTDDEDEARRKVSQTVSH